MKKRVLNLTIMIVIFNGITIGQSFEESNPYAFNAMTDAVKEFTQHELLSKKKVYGITYENHQNQKE